MSTVCHFGTKRKTTFYSRYENSALEILPSRLFISVTQLLSLSRQQKNKIDLLQISNCIINSLRQLKISSRRLENTSAPNHYGKSFLSQIIRIGSSSSISVFLKRFFIHHVPQHGRQTKKFNQCRKHKSSGV